LFKEKQVGGALNCSDSELCTFLLALAEGYLPTFYSDTNQSVRLSGMDIASKSYQHGKKTVTFHGFPSLAMCSNLTDTLGEELLTLYLEGFRAKTSVQQEKAQELTVSDQVCGSTWQGSLARLDPDTLLWRTAQCSLLEDLELSLQIFPRWGLMQNGALYPLPILVQTISVKEYGLEPNNETFFHTPNTTGLDGGSNGRKALKKRIENWPTPLASDWKPCGPNSKQQGLTEKVKMWPTPRSCSAMAATITPESAWNEKRNPNLETVVGQRMWPTPKTQDSQHALNLHNNQNDNHWKSNLGEVVSAQVNGGYLNPNWVEWLMNWPITWSGLNVIDPKEYQRWKETSTKTLQKSEQLREMWWDNDPSQASFGQQPNKQSEQQHCNAVPQMSRDTTRQREMEGSHEGSDLPLLCNDIYLSESQAENVQSGMWEQIGMDETKIVPRTDKNIVARVDRLKAIGNGQVPLCAATAWQLLG
jgi:DNA (cytosine-5)-methyltransferase 1